jgi:hypothetical protein
MTFKGFRQNGGADRIEPIENTSEARAQFGENYGAFEFPLTHEQIEGLLEGKVIAFDINGREYTGFLSLKKEAS